MATVDYYSPAAGATVTVGAAGYPAAVGGEFSCNACSEAFPSAAELRMHCKTERHVYNTKRRLAGLKPISQEAWERKLKESRGAAEGGPSKGTAHLKKQPAAGRAPPPRKVAGAGEAEPAAAAGPCDSEPSDADTIPFSPRRCLFDRRHFDDMEECLKYMWKTYDFAVPDREYCTDVPALLRALWSRISEEPHACLFCNRKFQDAGSCRRHMLDKRHARIGTEARTRTGKTDEAGSQELQEVLEEFYDFHGSTREVTERIRDPAEKAACLLRFFDADRDGRLNHAELSALWVAASAGAESASGSSGSTGGADSAEPTVPSEEAKADGAPTSPAAELSQAMYNGACGKAGVEPQEGLDAEALLTLYTEGLADLDAHFKLLQDLLAQKLRRRGQARREAEVQEEDDEEDGDGEAAAEDEDEQEDESDGGDDTEVLECDDEDEFEEVMRVLGLRPATIDDNGDLVLPNGSKAAHRDVAYIWRQRGTRLGNQLAVSGRPKGPPQRAMLMLSNSPAGVTRVAMSHRQQAREGKKIIAVLRAKSDQYMKLGIQHNNLQKKKTKIRTGMGDASGGR